MFQGMIFDAFWHRFRLHFGSLLQLFSCFFDIGFCIDFFIDFLVGNGRFLNGRTDGSTKTVAVERSVLPEWSVPER